MSEGAHAHGSLSEEARKLAEAVSDWMNGRAEDGERVAGRLDDPPECRVCPVCQLFRVVRGANPEVFAHLSDAAASLSAAFRELLSEASGPDPSATPRRGGVEHIDLG